ncbi:PD-(D/E)XK nuclease family protein [Microcella sp.]|uniref:PD-(D/E)XK nuclease family protein n=1 Tax=Microcella sp. TaxID=1913979 RepID=UPI0039199016
MPRLIARDPDARASPIALDDSQRAPRDALFDGAGSGVAVLGAPGTGKTALIVACVVEAVTARGFAVDRVMALTPSRRSATALRDLLAEHLAAAQPDIALPGPLARSVAAFAHAVLSAEARARGEEEPRLLSGSDQDSDIAELLAGHDDDGTGPAWPEHLGPEVRRLEAFRTELRDAIARLSEHDWTTDRLRREGAAHGRPEWPAIADFVDEYRRVLGGARAGQLDPAELVRAAADAVPRLREVSGVVLPELLLVDDAHDLTPAGIDLVLALAAQGTRVLVVAEPDVATTGFRGAEPEALGRLASVLGGGSGHPFVLATAHRQSAPLRALTALYAQRIGTAGAGRQRRAVAGHGDDAAPLGGALVALTASSPARERALIADVLRERHLIDGVPWARMAVLVRSGALVPAIVRALAAAEIPVRSTTAGRPLREHPAARALVRFVDVGVGRSPLDPDAATELLLGPLGGLDRVALRRLRRALRAEEVAGDGARTADDLLVEALSAPDRLVTIDHRTARQAARVARTLATIRDQYDAGATVDELLWTAWSDARVVDTWTAEARGTGTTAAEADRALDAVTAVFAAATTIVDTVPDATVDTFLTRMLDSDVADDLLAPARLDDAVLVASPAAAAGVEVDVAIIAGLTDGLWPNQRLRGSLLHAPDISRVHRGIASETLDERRLVLDDELRLATLAVSRARRQVIATSVAGDDDRPSALWDALADLVGTGPVAETARPRRPHARSFRRLVGELRRRLTDPASGETVRREAAAALRRLAAEGVPGASPDDWWGLGAPSTTVPLFGDDPVRLSPSKLEAIEVSPLDWFLNRVAPEEGNAVMGIGTIVHAAVETLTDPTVDEVWQAIEARWGELVFDSPWLAAQQRRLARRYARGVADYLRDAAAAGRVVAAAEHRFAVEEGRAVVSGIVDRIERDADGRVRIIDVKTGTPVTDAKARDNAQLGAYQLAYAEGAFDEVLDELGEHTADGARLLFVREGLKGQSYREATQPVLDSEALEAFRERLRQAVAAVAVAQLTGARVIDPYGPPGQRRHSIHRVPPVTGER